MFSVSLLVASLAISSISNVPASPSNDYVGQGATDSIIAFTKHEDNSVSPVYESELIPGSSESTQFYSPNEEDYISTTSIFGPDERTLLETTDYLAFPFRTVCLVHALFDTDNDGKSNYTGVGTGVLVGPRTVLTAAHVIFDNSLGIWPLSVEVYPGGHKASNGFIIAPFGKLTSISMSRGVNYETNDTADDWGLVELNRTIGSEIGYMGVSSELSNGNTVRLYGYHSDYDSRLGYGPGVVNTVELYKFRHNCDAIRGSSGGPITRGTTTVVGVHSGGYDNNWDQACKVSNFIVGWVEERIAKDE